jgi:c-di-GMP-related signal transduction protein
MPKEQLSRKNIERRLAELGLSELVSQAMQGHQGSLHQLRQLATENPLVEGALNLLQPRRNTENQRRREWVSPLEKAGRLSGGSIHIVQGGSPGAKKR